MVSQCRTCGQETDSNNSIDIFKGNYVIINQIALVTGVQLTDKPDFPKTMCFRCQTSLIEAIKFRELCFATNQRLHGEPIDFETENQGHLDDYLNSKKFASEMGVEMEITEDEEIEIIKQIKEMIEEDEAEYYNTHLHKQGRLKDLGKKVDVLRTYDINDNVVDTTNTETISSNSFHETELIPKEKTQKKVRKKYKPSKIYFCDQCGKEYNDKGNLNLHLVRHRGVKPFECPDCGKREFSGYLMNIHIRVKHRGEKPFACKYCKESFVDSTKRSRHQSRMHEVKAKNKRFKCAICDMRFEDKSALKKHEVVHSGERNFPCDICNVSFTRNFNLKTHFRSRQHIKAAEKSESLQ